MKIRFLILGLLLAAAWMCAADPSRFTLESEVQKQLLSLGCLCGFSEDGSVYTVVASASKPLNKMDSPQAMNVRFTCFRLAELKAQGEVLNALGVTANGGTHVSREGGADARQKTINTVFSTFSQRTLGGYDIVASREAYSKGHYIVALALRWSRENERRELAQLSETGSLNKPEWRAEFLEKAFPRDTLPPPTMTFADRAGRIHFLGVGFAQSLDESPLRKKAALNYAEMMARKNLQLRIYGGLAVQQSAQAFLHQAPRAGSEKIGTAYELLGHVSALTPLPEGAAEICTRRIKQPATGSDVFMVVYGF